MTVSRIRRERSSLSVPLCCSFQGGTRRLDIVCHHFFPNATYGFLRGRGRPAARLYIRRRLKSSIIPDVLVERVDRVHHRLLLHRSTRRSPIRFPRFGIPRDGFRIRRRFRRRRDRRLRVREILDGLLDVVFRDVLSSAMTRGRAHPPTVFVSHSRLFVTQTNEVTTMEESKYYCAQNENVFQK